MAWKAERVLPGIAAVTILLVGGMAVLAYRSTSELIANSKSVEASHRVLDALHQTVVSIQDAQRSVVTSSPGATSFWPPTVMRSWSLMAR